MQELSSRRQTFLSFQPPAVGDEEIEAVAETLRSGWLTTGPRTAELDGIEPLARDPRDTHALHLYVVRVDAERAGAGRDEYQRALADELIGTSIHFLPVHTLSAYRDLYPDQPPLPVAERAGRAILSLPLSPAHSDADVEDAIAASTSERFAL